MSVAIGSKVSCQLFGNGIICEVYPSKQNLLNNYGSIETLRLVISKAYIIEAIAVVFENIPRTYYFQYHKEKNVYWDIVHDGVGGEPEIVYLTILNGELKCIT